MINSVSNILNANKKLIFLIISSCLFSKNVYSDENLNVVSKKGYGFFDINIGDKLSLNNMTKINKNLEFSGFAVDTASVNGEPKKSFYSSYQLSINYENKVYEMTYITNTKDQKIQMATMNMPSIQFECSKNIAKYKNYYTFEYNASTNSKAHSVAKDVVMESMYDKKKSIMINLGCFQDKFSISLVNINNLSEDVDKIMVDVYEDK